MELNNALKQNVMKMHCEKDELEEQYLLLHAKGTQVQSNQYEKTAIKKLMI